MSLHLPKTGWAVLSEAWRCGYQIFDRKGAAFADPSYTNSLISHEARRIAELAGTVGH